MHPALSSRCSSLRPVSPNRPRQSDALTSAPSWNDGTLRKSMGEVPPRTRRATPKGGPRDLVMCQSCQLMTIGVSDTGAATDIGTAAGAATGAAIGAAAGAATGAAATGPPGAPRV